MIYIVAHNYREAVEVARRRELRPGAWRYLDSDYGLMGTRGAHVIVACPPYRLRPPVYRQLERTMQERGAQIEYIDCPYLAG